MDFLEDVWPLLVLAVLLVGGLWLMSATSPSSSWITDDETGCATIYYHDPNLTTPDVEWTKTYCQEK